jgi:hypothetical protein
MNWLKKWMDGRYGYDQLSMALLVLSFLLIVAAEFSSRIEITYLSLAPLGLCVYRTLSKQIQKRRLENYKFMMLLSPAYSCFNKKRGDIKDFRTYKYFRCPNCKLKLRVPRGKGKVIVTCFKCHTEFTKKT